MTLRSMLRTLRAEASPVLPVTVRREDLKRGRLYGYCRLSRDRSRFCIGLASDLKGDRLAEYLIHEWAHAMAWTEGRAVEEHDGQWGAAYARCYSLIFKPDERA